MLRTACLFSHESENSSAGTKGIQEKTILGHRLTFFLSDSKVSTDFEFFGMRNQKLNAIPCRKNDAVLDLGRSSQK